MAIEDEIAKKVFSDSKSEKTFIDKILGREDIKAIREIISKEIIDSKDISDLLYLVNSAEQKLYNYNDNERKVIGKFFVWVREVTVLYKSLYEYESDVLKSTEQILDNIDTKLILDIKRQFTHCISFMIDVLLYMERSSLSINATAFKELLRNKFEIKYDVGEQPKKSFFG